tara:strand:- start:734 stop:1354 length:621 start_codon:yes stop_codon:yes gene_type:complete
MIDLKNSDLFTPMKHEESGVTIHVLTRKVAPVQEAFYYVNDSMSIDGRYLWFYCAFPPSGNAGRGRTLGVVDFQTGEVRHFPESQFGEASPYVDVHTGEVYWQGDRFVWKRSPLAIAPTELINQVPDELIGDRQVLRAATHLTRSADGLEFLSTLVCRLNGSSEAYRLTAEIFSSGIGSIASTTTPSSVPPTPMMCSSPRSSMETP